MRTITCACLVLAAGMGLAWQLNASAGDEGKGPNVKAGEKQNTEGDGLSVLKLANDLTAWGRANQNAGAIALAARVMSTVQTTPMEKVDCKKVAGEEGVGAKKAKGLTADDLLAEAKALCGSDDKMKAEVDGIFAMGVRSRGTLQGAQWYANVSPVHGEQQYYFNYKGGELAEVCVSGDGASDLDVYVFDYDRNLITSDTEVGDSCHVSWVPQWTGGYYILVKNVGDDADAYTLWTN